MPGHAAKYRRTVPRELFAPQYKGLVTISEMAALYRVAACTARLVGSGVSYRTFSGHSMTVWACVLIYRFSNCFDTGWTIIPEPELKKNIGLFELFPASLGEESNCPQKRSRGNVSVITRHDIAMEIQRESNVWAMSQGTGYCVDLMHADVSSSKIIWHPDYRTSRIMS